MIVGIVHAWIGVAYLVVDVPSSALRIFGPATSIMPLKAWGVLSLLIGLGTIAATAWAPYRYVRLCQALGMAMTVAWFLSEAIAVISGNALLVSVPALWAFFAALHAVMIGEVPNNPARWVR